MPAAILSSAAQSGSSLEAFFPWGHATVLTGAGVKVWFKVYRGEYGRIRGLCKYTIDRRVLVSSEFGLLYFLKSMPISLCSMPQCCPQCPRESSVSGMSRHRKTCKIYQHFIDAGLRVYHSKSRDNRELDPVSSPLIHLRQP